MASAERPPVEFRRANVADVDNVVALVESCYRGENSRAGWTHEADLLDGQRTDAAEVSGIINSTTARILLADIDSQLVGCCQLERRPHQTAYLGMFAVSPKKQGNGLGRTIANEAERIARDDLLASEMRMSVLRQRTDLIAWYLRLGYQPNGESQPFPYGDERVGLPKRDDLEFVVLTKSLG